jgi:hypothetical protein
MQPEKGRTAASGRLLRLNRTLRGLVTSTGLDLPRCRDVCDHMQRMWRYDTTVQCIFPFSVKVPDTDFYAIEISHRGGANYTRSDLAHMHWHVDLDIG